MFGFPRMTEIFLIKVAPFRHTHYPNYRILGLKKTRGGSYKTSMYYGCPEMSSKKHLRSNRQPQYTAVCCALTISCSRSRTSTLTYSSRPRAQSANAFTPNFCGLRSTPCSPNVHSYHLKRLKGR